jgi:ADP-ribose pyrophosphatase
VTDLVPIATFYVSPAKTAQRTWLYCGRVDASRAGGVHGLAHEGEDIRVVCMPADEAIALVNQGRADSAWPLIALLWFGGQRAALRSRWCGMR